jgi:putative endonuclease
MTTHRQSLGRYGEQLAEKHLLTQGYTILAKNWRCPEGELDLVAQQGDEVVFVEVRTRRGNRLGSPEESVTQAKQARLIQLAYTFLAEYEEPDPPWRIDVIAIVVGQAGAIERLNHILYAVGAN